MPHVRVVQLLPCALALALLAPACKEEDPEPIAKNCDEPEGETCVPTQQPLEKIEAVDILVVMDNSQSFVQEAEALKQQLPRMLNAIVGGSDGETSFPPAASVHVAVTTSDMGALDATDIDGCVGLGDDGVFVRPGDVELSCDVSYPGYLAFDGAPAAVATVDTVGCVPLLPTEGCGFEQPMEAALKALWPASDSTVRFFSGEGHGEGANSGFLRDDSLLVVIVLTDEDDCSARDPRLFTPSPFLDTANPDDAALLALGLNTRCAFGPNGVHDTERYVSGLKALRPEHPERVIFAAIAGVPPELVPPLAPAPSEIADDAERDAAYDAMLAHPSMQLAIETNWNMDPQDDQLAPSCRSDFGLAYPPIRLVQTAKAFGQQGVIGSLCQDEFGDTMGMLIRTIGMRLHAAANGPADAGTGE